MMWESILFAVVALTAFSVAGYRLYRLTRLARNLKGTAPNRLKSTRDWITHSIDTLLYVFGQRAVLQKRWIGLAHALIFWGFLVITIGTLEQFLGTLIPGADFEFVGHTLYSAWAFVHDLFTMLVLVGLAYAAYRRFWVRPSYIGQSFDANLILGLTALLMFSILLMNGFHFLSVPKPWFSSSMPFSNAMASLLTQMGFGEGDAYWGYTTFKWIHMLLVLGFGVYIPGSKHLHVLAAAPNTFLRNIERPKAMRPINFEDETLEQYGAAKISDLSWKDALDTYACTECGRCQELCPAWNTGKPLSPKNLIHDIKLNLLQNEAAIAKKDYESVTPLIGSALTEDVIWACTSCRACEVACPVFIEQTDKIYEARRNLVMMESRFPTEVQTVFRNMETNSTPWAFSASDRAAWAEGLEIPTLAEEPNAEILLWVGCAGAYDSRNQKVLQSVARVLKRAGVSFAILGTEEQCTGDPARRIGNEYLFQTLATANVETLNRYQVKRIVTACPHCFNTLKNEYPDFGGHYEVHHHSQLLATLLREGRIRPAKTASDSVAFHDSCYLGRWNGEYNAPRSVLNALPGTEVRELKQNHDKSLCCGAGGGRMWMEETLGTRINLKRTEQALETGAQTIAAACPFCLTMLADGVKAKDAQNHVSVKDVAELLDESTSS